MLDERVVFLDLETTGGSLLDDRIIEIGLVEVDCGRFAGEWSTLVNPERRVPHSILVLTGIAPEMLEQAPTFEALADVTSVATCPSRRPGRIHSSACAGPGAPRISCPRAAHGPCRRAPAGSLPAHAMPYSPRGRISRSHACRRPRR